MYEINALIKLNTNIINLNLVNQNQTCDGKKEIQNRTTKEAGRAWGPNMTVKHGNMGTGQETEMLQLL